MDLWIAELYDYCREIPMLVGIYDSEEKADEAVAIVLRQHRQKEPNTPEGRFFKMVNRVQLNGFCPAVMDNLGWEGM